MKNNSILIATSIFAEHFKESLSILEKTYSRTIYNKLLKKLTLEEFSVYNKKITDIDK